MAINKKLIHFKTYAAYKKENDAGNIPNYSIVFIQDAKKIVTHGWEGNMDSLTTTEVTSELNKKQDKLTPGQGIEITTDNIINVTLDTTVFRVVSELPTQNIETNKIYLVPGEDEKENNIYTEYLYVEDKWEILGEYRAEFNIDEYLRIEDYNKWRDGLPQQSVESISGQLIYNPYNVQVAYAVNSRHGYDFELEPADNHNFVIDGATEENAGAMPAADKVTINRIHTVDIIYLDDEHLESNKAIYDKYLNNQSTIFNLYFRNPRIIGAMTFNYTPITEIRKSGENLIFISSGPVNFQKDDIQGIGVVSLTMNATGAITSTQVTNSFINDGGNIISANNGGLKAEIDFLSTRKDDGKAYLQLTGTNNTLIAEVDATSIYDTELATKVDKTEFEQYKADTKAITDKLRTDIDYERERALEAEQNINNVLDKAVLFDDTKKIITIPESGALFGVFVGEETAGCNIAALKNYDDDNVLEIGSTQVHLAINTSDNIQVDTPDGTKHVAYQEDLDNKYKTIVIDSSVNNLDNYNLIKSRITNNEPINVIVLENNVYYPATFTVNGENIDLTASKVITEDTGVQLDYDNYTIDNTGAVTHTNPNAVSIYSKAEVDEIAKDTNIKTLQWVYFSESIGLEDWQQEHNVTVFEQYKVAWEGGIGVNDVDTSFRLVGTAWMDSAKSKCTITGIYNNVLYTYTLTPDGNIVRATSEISNESDVYVIDYIDTTEITGNITAEQYQELINAIDNSKIIILKQPNNGYSIFIIGGYKPNSYISLSCTTTSQTVDRLNISRADLYISSDLQYNIASSNFELNVGGDGTKFLSDDGTYKTINTDTIDSTNLADTHYLQNQTSILECMKILDNKLYELEQALTIKEG